MSDLVQRLRKLHVKVEKVCTDCSSPYCEYSYCKECMRDYPCKTVLELDK